MMSKRNVGIRNNVGMTFLPRVTVSTEPIVLATKPSIKQYITERIIKMAKLGKYAVAMNMGKDTANSTIESKGPWMARVFESVFTGLFHILFMRTGLIHPVIRKRMSSPIRPKTIPIAPMLTKRKSHTKARAE